MSQEQYSYLKRLPSEYYRGTATVHWSLTMENRKVGWLIPIFYYKFRELLAHAAFRYGFCCPMYCCMPDHLHLLWAGILDNCDQRIGMRYFRKQINLVLEKLDTRLQLQPYDHVLKEEECRQSGVEEVAEYIARNPERKKLVPQDGFSSYPFTGCLIPGYPEIKPFEPGYWERFWRVYAHLVTNGLQATSNRQSKA